MVLIDSNLSPSWLPYLGDAKVESVHWMRMGKQDSGRDELLRWALEHNATILTSSGELTQVLVLRRLERPSVVYLRTQERNPDAVGKRVLKACRKASRKKGSSMVITIDEHGDRERALPIVRQIRHAEPEKRSGFAIYARLRKFLFLDRALKP